jgi:hypothetical protein
MVSPTTGVPPLGEVTRARRGGLWPVLKGIAAATLLVLLAAATLIVWPLVSPPDPDASLRLVNGRLLGETSGYLARIDHERRTVDVSASILGVRPVGLVVDAETVILVQDRQGGFGDLWNDLPVRVSYEMLGATRLARVIEILTGAAGKAPTPSSPPEIAPVPPPAVRVQAPAVDPPLPARAQASQRAVSRPPARPVATPAAKAPVTRADDGTDADIADGTAAIDWLIRSRRP